MAVVQNPITGRSSGKFAGAIFAKWKNKNTLRSKPITVNNPDTPAQQMRRSMFAELVDLGRKIRPLIEVGFQTFKAVETWMNSFIKYNNNTFTVPGTPPAFTTDYAELLISKGPLTITPITAVVGTDASDQVTITYPTDLIGIDQNDSDTAYAFAFNSTANSAGASVGTALRSDGTLTITMTGNSTTGDLIYGYLFFLSADGESVSDTMTDTVTVS